MSASAATVSLRVIAGRGEVCMSGTLRRGKSRAWLRASELAANTPSSRNRYVDFLRAASICVVIVGHWLIAAPFVEDGTLRFDNMLNQAPWTQWLTWAFQVMPLFFIVGGYSNGISWQSAKKANSSYNLWLAARLNRLIGPIVPLIILWALIAVAARYMEVDPGLIKSGSQLAMIPTWFLAVYIMVVVLTPVTHHAWHRFGMGSFWGLALGAAVIDFVGLSFDLPLLRWVNYGFVWLSVHQLGYLWHEGRILGWFQALRWAASGLLLLLILIYAASYPISMLTVPGEVVSNSRPPSLALLALGVLHFGVLLALEQPLRRWLQKPLPWTVAVLVNGTIMTLYLWHVTVMVLVVGLLNLLGAFGLGVIPDTPLWWATRPLWILLLGGILLGFVALFSRFEQTAKSGTAIAPPTWLMVIGAICVCLSLAAMTLHGIHIGALFLALAGAFLVLGKYQRLTETH